MLASLSALHREHSSIAEKNDFPIKMVGACDLERTAVDSLTIKTAAT